MNVEWRTNNPDYKQDSERMRSWHLKKKYYITPEGYELLLKQQGGVCAICHKPPTEERLCVDHDHVSGKVRGLLHRWCNSAIGLLEDDVQLLLNAIDYLRGTNVYTVSTES